MKPINQSDQFKLMTNTRTRNRERERERERKKEKKLSMEAEVGVREFHNCYYYFFIVSEFEWRKKR